jgi:glycosyltransferase involved in cell wall biosynthesis
VQLTVVGRNPSLSLVKELKAYPEITITGRVDDVRPFISSHALYVIPLRIGSGTRIKAYEAMAMGKAVVSTSIGVEGLPVVSGVHVSIADNVEGLASEIIRLLQTTEARTRLGSNARSFVCKHFAWDTVAEVFAAICRRVSESRRSDGPGWTPELLASTKPFF